MTLQMINYYIENSDSLDASSLQVIEEAERKYPYFQTLKLLKLKNLANVRSLRLSKELSKNIAYFTDRKHLLTVLNNEEFLWIKLLKQDIEKNNSKENLNDSFALIELFLSRINDSSLSDTLPYEIEGLSEVKEEVTSDLLKEIEEKPDMKVDNADEDTQLQMINNFLNVEHETLVKSLIPEQTLNYVADVSTNKEIKDEMFLTESLAKIYIKQKKYGKALEIIKKLSLKYPEKNVYFADQIRFLEIIISNIKTK